MKILCVSNLYPPYTMGGYEQLCHQVMQALGERGHEVFTATGRARSFADNGHIRGVFDLDLEHIVDEYVGIYQTPRLHLRFKRFLFHPGNYHQTVKMIKEIRPDIVSFWNLFLLSVSPMIAARRMGMKSVTHLTDRWLLYSTKDVRPVWNESSGIQKLAFDGMRAIVQPILHAATHPEHLIVPSSSIRQSFIETGFHQEAFHLIPHGINVDMFPEVPREETGRARLLFVGRLWEGKGPQVLLRALGALKRDGCLQFHLDIYGEGVPSFMDYLHQIIEEEQIEDLVTFCGFVAYSDLPSVYQTHDILVFPALWEEPFALVPLEAMSTALPIIATSAGGTKEAVHDQENGIIVPPNDSQALAHAIRTLLQDRDLRRRLGKHGAEMARGEYSFTHMVDRVEALYLSIIGQ